MREKKLRRVQKFVISHSEIEYSSSLRAAIEPIKKVPTYIQCIKANDKIVGALACNDTVTL